MVTFDDNWGPGFSSGEDAGAARPPWVDRRIQEMAVKPWRKIHLDFHNTPFVGEVGHGFDPDEFIARLRAGHVNAIVVFAKDMHGYFYFPSKRGPVHPGLDKDLLGEQVAACRNAGIAVYGYYCVTWDNLMAEEHPEWLVMRRDRTTYLPRFDETPRWTALCLSNRGFVDVVLDDSREMLSGYELDGIWYDMPLPIGGECFCHNCLSLLRNAGVDPLDVVAQRSHKQQLLTGFLREARELVEEVRPGCQIDHNNQTRLGLGERARFMDNIDIEALPTGGWGYGYFPVDVRYARNFGLSVYGMTGRFHRSWADFGGLKEPRQLAVEVASIVAQGARCSVGDQPPPSARLDKAVYDTVGAAYAEVERLEEFLEGAAPVVEAAIVVDGLPLVDPAGKNAVPEDGGSRLGESVVGATELLVDQRLQFDVVEADADFDRYRLLVVPDGLQVSAGLAGRLRGFVERGGALLAFGGGEVAGTEESWLAWLGVDLRGRSPFSPAYLLPREQLSAVLPSFEYALYDGTSEWAVRPGPGLEVWADVGVPEFQRSPEHYTSHAQSPYARTTEFAAVVRTGRVGAVAFDLAAMYHRTGYWPYRAIVGSLLDTILPRRLVRSRAPRCAEITLSQQRRDGRERWLVHVVNTATGRRWGPRLELFEDPISLSDVRVELDLPVRVVGARNARTGEAVHLGPVGSPGEPQAAATVEIALPSVGTGCVVVLDVEGER